MRHRLLPLLSLLLAIAASPSHADDVMRYQLKAPILFSSGGGSPTDPEGPPGGGTNQGDLTVQASPGSWRVGDDIAFPVVVTGGTPPYYANDPSVGLGALQYDAALGTVYGQVDVVAPPYERALAIRVRDASGAATGVGTPTIAVYPELAATVDATSHVSPMGSPIAISPQATGVVGTPLWSLVGGNERLGELSFDPGTGEVGGDLDAPGSIAFRLRVTDSIDQRHAETDPITITYSAPPIVVDVADATVRYGNTASIPVSIAGGFQPPALSTTLTVRNASNQVVSGLVYDVGSGRVTGSLPVGDYTATLTSSNVYGSGSKSFSVAVVSALSVSYPSTIPAVPDVEMTPVSPSVSGATGTRTWAYAAGSQPLPDGLDFDRSTGTISGTPTTSGTFGGIQLTMTDALGSATTNAFSVVVAVDEIVRTTASSGTNIVVYNAFTPAEWASTKTKRIIVPQGAVLGSTNILSGAVRTGATPWGGTLVFEVRGSIQGKGGLGSTAIGGNGGIALQIELAGLPVEIDVKSTGAILAGGGGGGGGGAGGVGKVGGGAGYWGGSGGTGGNGQGYNQSATAGANGLAGQTRAGAGGKGGFGGSWGMNGNTGSRGSNGDGGSGSNGYAGGQAGQAVTNSASVVRFVNAGIVSGRDIPAVTP